MESVDPIARMEIIQDFLNNFRFSDKRVGLKLVRHTFSGSHFHEWMRMRRYETNETEGLAVKLGQQMIDEGQIQSISKTSPGFSISPTSFYVKKDDRRRGGVGGNAAISASQRLAASSRGLRQSLDFIPRMVKKKDLGLPTSPIDPASSMNSMQSSSAASASLSGFTAAEGLMLKKSNLQSLESMESDGDDEGVALASFDPLADDEVGEDGRKGSSFRRAMTHSRSIGKRDKSSFFTQYLEGAKEAREVKKLVRENTKANRSMLSVQEYLATYSSVSEEEEVLSIKAAAPLCSSQWLDVSKLNIRRSIKKDPRGVTITSTDIRFNDRTTVYKFDEEDNMVETIRVPIDYSIKKRLKEPAMKISSLDLLESPNLLA